MIRTCERGIFADVAVDAKRNTVRRVVGCRSLGSEAKRDAREDNVEEDDQLHAGCARVNKVVE